MQFGTQHGKKFRNKKEAIQVSEIMSNFADNGCNVCGGITRQNFNIGMQVG